MIPFLIRTYIAKYTENGGIMMNIKVERKSVRDLIPADYNPRKALKPADPEYKRIERSIEEFGYVDPIIWNERTGTIVGGHQRLTVMKNLGVLEVDVSVVDLDETAEKALNIALNKITGEWDDEALASLLKDLDGEGYDLDITGFSMDEVTDLFDAFDEPLADPEEDNFDLDEAMENAPAISQLGDVWRLGNHRLMCGDSTSEADVSVLMDGNKAQMVFTDPPWNVNYGDVKEGNSQGYKPRKILNDFMGTEDFKQFMNAIFANSAAFSEDGACTYVVMSAQEWGNMMLTLAMNDYHWSSTIIWAKDSLVLSRKDYHTQYEPIWYGWKGGAPRLMPLEDRKQSDVWEVARPKKSELHPTMKPIELVARAINNSSKRGWTVLDLFGGSGSTLIASEQTGRVNRSMELDPRYVDVIVERYKEWKGNTEDIVLIRNGVEIAYSDVKPAEVVA